MAILNNNAATRATSTVLCPTLYIRFSASLAAYGQAVDLRLYVCLLGTRKTLPQ